MTRVNFERTGGFAGMRLSTTIDSQSLGEAEASQLEQAINDAGFFDLPARIESAGVGADRFEYHIQVERQGHKHSVDVGEAALPDSLRPLIEHLERLLRTRR